MNTDRHGGGGKGAGQPTWPAAAIAMVAAALLAACVPRPAVPGGPAPAFAAAGDAEGLRLVDLRGAAEPRPLLLGGGWQGAAWIGCTDFLALDRTVDHDRRLAVLDVQDGQLYPADVRPIAELALQPGIVDALVAAFGEDAAFPQDRLKYGALRPDADGRPVLEVVGSGEQELPDRVVGAEPLVLAAPVEHALAGATDCSPAVPVRWVFRSPCAGGSLGGEPASWSCEAVGGAAAGGRGDAGPGADDGESAAGGIVGTTVRGDEPLVLDLPGGGSATLPGSAPVGGGERCASPDGTWLAVRVEQPGVYGFEVLYVVRLADARVVRVARYDLGGSDAAGIAALAPDLLLFGGPDGWFVIRDEGDPERVGDFLPAVR